MERNSSRSNLKQHRIGKSMKDSWDNQHTTNVAVEDEHHHLLLSGFSRSSRPYTCSFCKRKFRSAQALGGHMNVHRRERARLRNLSPPPLPSPTPMHHDCSNPNPSPNLSSPPTRFPPSFTSTLSSLVSLSTSFDKNPSIQTTKFLFGEFEHCGGFTDEKECNTVVRKEAEFGRLDLEIGLLRGDSKDLDLELRLGYS